MPGRGLDYFPEQSFQFISYDVYGEVNAYKIYKNIHLKHKIYIMSDAHMSAKKLNWF